MQCKNYNRDILRGGEEVARTGRPKSMNARVRNVTIRLTSREYEDVSAYAAGHGQTVTKTLLDGFYTMNGKQKPDKDS